MGMVLAIPVFLAISGDDADITGTKSRHFRHRLCFSMLLIGPVVDTFVRFPLRFTADSGVFLCTQPHKLRCLPVVFRTSLPGNLVTVLSSVSQDGAESDCKVLEFFREWVVTQVQRDALIGVWE